MHVGHSEKEFSTTSYFRKFCPSRGALGSNHRGGSFPRIWDRFQKCSRGVEIAMKISFLLICSQTLSWQTCFCFTPFGRALWDEWLKINIRILCCYVCVPLYWYWDYLTPKSREESSVIKSYFRFLNVFKNLWGLLAYYSHFSQWDWLIEKCNLPGLE